jgi:hypothetical protein
MERCILEEQIEKAIESNLKQLKTSFINYKQNKKHISDRNISKYSLSDRPLDLGRVRHAAKNDDISRSHPLVENPVSVEPNKKQMTEYQETLHDDPEPSTNNLDTQNGPEKDSGAVF